MSAVFEILLVLVLVCCGISQASSLARREVSNPKAVLPPITEENCVEAKMLRDLASQQNFGNSTRSFCNWTTKLNQMENRYPKILIEVGCNLTNTDDMYHCEPLYYNIPVAKLSFDEWTWELEKIPVACIYARKFTRSSWSNTGDPNSSGSPRISDLIRGAHRSLDRMKTDSNCDLNTWSMTHSNWFESF